MTSERDDLAELGRYAFTRLPERRVLGVPGGAAPPPADDATAAVAALQQAFALWQSVLSAVPEASLAKAIGPVGGPYADSTKRSFVLHVLDKLLHHAAEVALVRDLWAAQGRG